MTVNEKLRDLPVGSVASLSDPADGEYQNVMLKTADDEWALAGLMFPWEPAKFDAEHIRNLDVQVLRIGPHEVTE